MKLNLEKLKEVHGDVLSLITPSGYQVTIRQQTGEDDDILSSAEGVMDGTSSNKFIQGIVVHTDITENGKFNLDTARNIKLCDKYFIMVASRIFSIGQTLKFTYEWLEKKKGVSSKLPVEYEEDLGLYIWDYGDENKPFPKLGDEDYFQHRIKPHKFGKDTSREFKLGSGKALKYSFMNGHGERWLMDLPEERQSVNAELLARNLELKIKDEWVKVQNFKSFTPIDMREIRNEIIENDTIVSLITELQHPETKEIFEFPIVGSADFFYPREI